VVIPEPETTDEISTKNIAREKVEREAAEKAPGITEKIPGSQPVLQQSTLKWVIIGAIGLLVVATGAWGISYLAGLGAPTQPEAPAELAQPEPTAIEMAEGPVIGEIDCKGAQPGDEINMLYQWSGVEEERLNQILQPLVDTCGIVLRPESTRDQDLFDTRVEASAPPDVAFWNVFQLQKYQNQLFDMNTLGASRGAYIPGAIDQGVIDGRWLGLPVKSDIKSIIWYSPVNFDALGYTVPTTWEALEDLVERIANDPHSPVPWSMGLESGAATGWTGSDFIQDILLVQQGPQYVMGIIDGSIPYDDEGVKQAYETYGRWAREPAYTIGGADGTLNIPFLEAIYLIFYSPPEAMMVKQAGFASGEIAFQFPDLEFGTDYDFFIVPGARGLQGSSDWLMAFSDKPAVQALVTYLSSPEGGANWAKANFGLSPNQSAAGNYTDSSLLKWAEAFYNTEGFTPDLGDTIPGGFGVAEWAVIVDYLNGADLNAVLAQAAAVQQEATGR
jgi:alpha-glucoside transport system substrate-binding protein